MKVLMSVIIVCIISVPSVFTLTWLKALAGGAQDVSDRSLKSSTSRLRPHVLLFQSVGQNLRPQLHLADSGSRSYRSSE